MDGPSGVRENYSSRTYGEISVDEHGTLQETASGAPPPPPRVPTPGADLNAWRTTEQAGAHGYFEQGLTASDDAYFVGVAGLKGREASGLELEVFTLSGQVGGQYEIQAGLARTGVSSDGGSGATLETMTAKANLGIHNPDGSLGFHLGAVATAVGVEGTINTPYLSVTVGASIAVGVEASAGERDLDRDGKAEYCLRAGGGALGKLTVGLCLEDPR